MPTGMNPNASVSMDLVERRMQSGKERLLLYIDPLASIEPLNMVAQSTKILGDEANDYKGFLLCGEIVIFWTPVKVFLFDVKSQRVKQVSYTMPSDGTYSIKHVKAH